MCPNCWGSLEPWRGSSCAGCGLPFPSTHALDSTEGLCGQCRTEAYKFDLARSYGLYSGNLRAAILGVKFQRRNRLGRALGKLLAPVWDAVCERGEANELVLVPVPLHPSRERERGFNQAEALAEGLHRTLARAAGAPPPRLERRLLRRTRATAPQTGLSLSARQDNVRGVFEVTPPRELRDKAVVLVDDVMTTGATLSACAAALKRAGARRVVALTLARATPRFPDDIAAAPGLPVDESPK